GCGSSISVTLLLSGTCSPLLRVLLRGDDLHEPDLAGWYVQRIPERSLQLARGRVDTPRLLEQQIRFLWKACCVRPAPREATHHPAVGHEGAQVRRRPLGEEGIPGAWRQARTRPDTDRPLLPPRPGTPRAVQLAEHRPGHR